MRAMPSAGNADELRDQMVDELCDRGHIRSGLVEGAFRTVSRHVFLPDEAPRDVYSDRAFLTKCGPDGRPVSSSSQPAIMAIMLEQLGLEGGQRVLEIGAGTGYNAALINHAVGAAGTVVTVDIDADLAEHARARLRAAGFPAVEVVCADGTDGLRERAPYDRIVATVGAWDIAPAWLDQLADGGRLVVPLSLRGAQRSIAFERADGHLRGVSIRDCGFMRLRGAGAGPETVIALGDEPGLFIELDEDRPVDPAALHRSLVTPGEELPGGVRVSSSDLWGGLGLWLALNEPGVARLYAIGAAVERGIVPALFAYPGQVGTIAIVDRRTLACLVRADEAEAFPVGARAYGQGACDLASRLVDHVRTWDRRGRPSTAGLHVRAYPAGTPLAPDAIVIDKRHARLVLDWL